MGFFSPWFLAGMAALALPVWLHLLRRFQKTPRAFSSLMFFERRVQSSTRHRRLRYLLLLALRMAVLALLALAFAGPFWNVAANTAARPVLTVIAIDRSFSMRQGERMQQAKAEAKRLIAALPGRTRVQVAAFDAHLDLLTQPEFASAAAAGAVDALTVGDEISSYGEVARGLRALAESSGLRVEAHVITDEQKTSLPDAFTDLSLGRNVQLRLHCVGSNAPNWAVESVTAPARVFDAAPQRIQAVLAGWNTGAAVRTAVLEIDGKAQATRSVTVPANGRVQLEFDGVTVAHGAHRAQVRIDPHDTLAEDDVFAFAMERRDAQRVLFLGASGRANDSFFYRSALQGSGASGFAMETRSMGELDTADLSHYAFVVLENPGVLSETGLRRLGDYVRGGGGLFIAAGANTARQGSVPLSGQSIALGGERQSAGQASTANPVLTSGADFQNVEFVDVPRLGTRPGDRVWAKFADGMPLLVESRLSEGKVLVFASTLDNAGSDFPLHASFLPFVRETAAYLAGSEGEPGSVTVGTPIALRASNAQSTAADVRGPGGERVLSLSEATRAMNVVLGREGFYDIQRADKKRLLVAAHADRRESDLTQAPGDVLKIWRNTGSNSAEPAAGIQRQTVRRELWQYVLALALAAALVESIFGMRYLSGEGRAG